MPARGAVHCDKYQSTTCQVEHVLKSKSKTNDTNLYSTSFSSQPSVDFFFADFGKAD